MHHLIAKVSDRWRRGRRHAANVSVAQQLVGPLRARADLRFSLHVPGGYSPVSHRVQHMIPTVGIQHDTA
jgi:hypothetical protein